jgi:hypothetical protein
VSSPQDNFEYAAEERPRSRAMAAREIRTAKRSCWKWPQLRDARVYALPVPGEACRATIGPPAVRLAVSDPAWQYTVRCAERSRGSFRNREAA